MQTSPFPTHRDMKTISMFLTGLLTFALASAEPVRFGDTQITFEPPKGFKSLPQELMDLKWPGARAPNFAVGNESGSTTVGYDLKPHVIPQDKMGEVQKNLEEPTVKSDITLRNGSEMVVHEEVIDGQRFTWVVKARLITIPDDVGKSLAR